MLAVFVLFLFQTGRKQLSCLTASVGLRLPLTMIKRGITTTAYRTSAELARGRYMKKLAIGRNVKGKRLAQASTSFSASAVCELVTGCRDVSADAVSSIAGVRLESRFLFVA